MRLGFVGAGTIGGGMARRALAAGHSVAVFDLSAAVRAEMLAAGAEVSTSAAALTRSSECMVVCLPRAEDVEVAFHGPDGILAGLTAGVLVIESSSTPPESVKVLQAEFLARGARLVDAPLCPSQNREIPHRSVPPEAASRNAGGRAAWAGNLCFFVGGADADVAVARPVLDMLGIEAHHVGELGAGKLVKLLHNAINLTALAAISETMVVAKRSGLNVKTVVDALTTSLADSAMLRTQGRDYIANEKFPRGLFPLHYSLKDLRYALECARAVGVAPEVTRASESLFARASTSRWGGYYNPALFRFIEEEASSRGT